MPGLGLGLADAGVDAGLAAATDVGADVGASAFADVGAGAAADLGAGGLAGLGAGAAEAGAGAADLAGSAAFDTAAAAGAPLTSFDLAGGGGDIFGGIPAGASFNGAPDLTGFAGIPDAAQSAAGLPTAATGAGSALPSISPIGAAGSVGPSGLDVGGDLFGPDALNQAAGTASPAVQGGLGTETAAAGSAPAAPAAADTSMSNLALTGNSAGTVPPTNLTGTAATPAAATPAAAAGSGGFSDLLKKNPLMLASLGIGAGSLAFNGLTQKLPQQSNLQGVAGSAQNLQAQDQQLQTELINPLLTGVLPQDAEAQLQMGLNDAMTATKSKYAQLGLSGSTAEQDQLNYLRQQSDSLRFTIAEQMATTAMTAGSQAATALGIQESVFQALMTNQIQQDNALQQAIAGFAGQAALAGAISGGK